MSQENVEIVRSIYEAAKRRDWDRAFRDQHPDVEWIMPPGLVAGTFRGREEIKRFWEDWAGTWEQYSVEPTDIIESGDKVVVLSTVRLVPKGGSAAAIEIHNGHLWCLRDGKAVSMRAFPNPEDALKAAGLRE